ncbi:MAG TPA: hypothetical protein VK543_15755 [Puia sp.]|nr:hypothetical protein [Puia sp.]
MKTLLPILALVCIIAIGAGSSALYLNMNYISSTLLTVSTVLGIAFLIGFRAKEKETK